MARIRTIKPDAFTSESLSSVSIPARWTFAGLWTYLDDDGRGRADTRLIKAALYPLDDEIQVDDIEDHLSQLEQIGAVCRYEANGRLYLHAPKFTRHQRVNRKTDSTIPECSRTTHGALTEPSVSAHVVLTDNSRQEGKGREGNREGEMEVRAERADVESLCTYLADKIEANGSKRPTVTTRWRDACRLLLDKDGRTVDQVRAAIDWSQADEFWRANVLSMPTLREKYDQLRLAAARGTRTRTQADEDFWQRAMTRAQDREARTA